MEEAKFREEVCKGLSKRQQERFIEGREKYGNDPSIIDYDEEIQQEQDDIVIYQMMAYIINGK